MPNSIWAVLKVPRMLCAQPTVATTTRRPGARLWNAAGIAGAALVLSAGLSLTLAATPEARPGVDWPSFRGIRASGVAEGFATPVTWNVPTGEHVRWKTPIPGLGHSSPIVWGDQVCVTAAASQRGGDPLRVGLYGDVNSLDEVVSQTWTVWCLDKHTGAVRWTRAAHSGVPKTKRHPKGTYANSTLATNGRYLVAWFGSEGLYAFDLAGRPQWTKDLGVIDAGFHLDPSAQFGTASSPVIHDDLVIVQADSQTGGFLAAFDVLDGREVWRTPRQDVPTWSTPTIHIVDGSPQVVLNGWKHAGAYDLRSGREIWRLSRGGNTPVATPVTGYGLVFLTSAQLPISPIYGIQERARGDLTPSADAELPQGHVAWKHDRDGAYMQTPIVYDQLLYVGRITGVVNAFEAGTGRHVYRARLGVGGGFTASAVAADGKLYYTSEDGDVFVVRAGRQFEVVARNSLGEVTLASPAVSEGTLYFRTRHHLVAVGETPRPSP